MDLDQARTFLPEARELADLANPAWFETCSTEVPFAEISYSDRKTGEIVPIAHVLTECPFDDKRLMVLAPTLMRALLVLLDEAFRVIKANRPPEDPQAADRRRRDQKERDKDYAAECAMKCDDRLFRRFLVERYEVPDVTDHERIAVSVRNILRVKSRGELNTDPQARRRWIDFRSDFEAWRTHV